MNILDRQVSSLTAGCSRSVPACVRPVGHRSAARLLSAGDGTRQTACFVLTPARPGLAVASKPQELESPPTSQPQDLLATIVAPVQEDMVQMNKNLKSVVGDRHPMLMAAAEQIFGAGGKKLRPLVVFLVAHSTAQLMGMK